MKRKMVKITICFCMHLSGFEKIILNKFDVCHYMTRKGYNFVAFFILDIYRERYLWISHVL